VGNIKTEAEKEIKTNLENEIRKIRDKFSRAGWFTPTPETNIERTNYDTEF